MKIIKNLIIVLIGINLLFVGTQATAAVKAGATCTKLGATSTSAGKKYTCIKSGKKLAWNKGVAVVTKPTPVQTPAVSPAATPTPTPSATPTVAPTPIPQPTQTARPINQLFWKFKVESNVLYRNVEANGSWLTTDSRKNDEFDPIRVKAWQEIKSVAIPNERQKSVTYFVGPNVDPAVENAYRFLIEKSLLYFNSWMKPEVPLFIHIYTEKDREFFKQSMEIYVNGAQDYSRLEADLKNYDGPNSNFSPSGGVTIGALKTKSTDWVNFATFALDSELRSEGILMYMIPHEISHHWQFSTMQPLMRRSGSDRSSCNFFEGGAVLLGSSIAVDHLGWFSDEMDVITRRISQNSPQFNPKTSEEIVEELMKFSSSSASNALGCTTGYSLGALAYEWLIAEKGIQILQDLTKAFNATTSVSDGIKQATGWSDRDFYTRASEYVLRAWNRAVSLKP
jgi:hypothetical protein